MNPRDRRALVFLAAWGGVLLLWWGWRTGRAWLRERKTAWAQVTDLSIRTRKLEQEFGQVQAEAKRLSGLLPSKESMLSEDQIRLKGQSTLLEVAEAAGVKGVKLRPDPSQSKVGDFRSLRWVMEGEGSLPQWVDVFQKTERIHPLMRVDSFRLEAIGDPWTFATSSGPDGPQIRGAVVCSWLVRDGAVVSGSTSMGVPSGPASAGGSPGIRTP